MNNYGYDEDLEALLGLWFIGWLDDIAPEKWINENNQQDEDEVDPLNY